MDTNLFNYKQEINKDIDIIFVGTFRKLKGPDRIVMMSNDLKKYFPNIKLNYWEKVFISNCKRINL